jgi:hypothetical protein
LDLEFLGELWYWRGPSPYHFITVPEEACIGLRAMSALVSYGWGMIPAAVHIGASQWETALFAKDGRYVLPVKDRVRKAEGLSLGDRVNVRVVVGH